MKSVLNSKYSQNVSYEGQDLLDIFSIRGFTSDKECRILVVESECNGYVLIRNGSYHLYYRRGDSVPSRYCKYIPCNVWLFTCKCRNGVFQFFWK